MAPDRLRDALHATPFRPFHVETPGGKRVRVKHTDYALLSPNGRTLVVCTEDNDAMEIIAVFDSKLSFERKKASKRK